MEGEPDQWLAKKVAREALADAGYGDEIPERHRTAVILGKGTYLNRGNLSVLQHGAIVDQTLAILKRLHPEFTAADIQLIRQDLKRSLPPFNADTAPGLIPNIIAGRIANRLDLMGPSSARRGVRLVPGGGGRRSTACGRGPTRARAACPRHAGRC